MLKGIGKVIREIREYACKERKTERKAEISIRQREEQGGGTPSR